MDMFSEYNPQLAGVSPTTRVAYAKFMRSKIKADFLEREKHNRMSDSEFSLVDEVFETPKKRDSCRRCSGESRIIKNIIFGHCPRRAFLRNKRYQMPVSIRLQFMIIGGVIKV